MVPFSADDVDVSSRYRVCRKPWVYEAVEAGRGMACANSRTVQRRVE